MNFTEEMDLLLGLCTQNNIIQFVDSLSNESLFELIETIYLSTKYHFPPPSSANENFSFVANSTLSGNTLHCSNIQCRLEKLDELASFTSLYADVVYINNPFEKLYQTWSTLDINTIKYEASSSIVQYYYLKPYFSLGLIRYAFGYVSLCSYHHETLAKPLIDKIAHKELELVNILHEHFIESCSITLGKYPNGIPFIEVKDNSNIIEHGRIYYQINGLIKSNFLQNLIKTKNSHIFSRKEIIQEDILSLVINPLVTDFSEQEWISYFYKSSLLVDNQRKNSLFSALSTDTIELNAIAFNHSVDHYLPTIHSNDPLEIINYRLKEEEAFKVYRDKLHKLLINAPKQDPKYIPEMFRDIILPEINVINKKMKDFQSRKKINLRDKLLFGSGAITFGLYSGILPSNIGSILAAIGGGSAIVSSMIDYKNAFFSKDEARANDYYFLWELTK